MFCMCSWGDLQDFKNSSPGGTMEINPSSELEIKRKYAPMIAKFGGNPFPRDRMPPMHCLIVYQQRS
jgi:hypothetical protein